MFVETYYGERAAAASASTGELTIPYPELSGEELMLWRKYLRVRREIRNPSLWFYGTIPHPVIEEIEKARRAPRLV
jgi:hypothetical protein